MTEWIEYSLIPWIGWHQDLIAHCAVAFLVGMTVAFALVAASLRRPS